MILHATHTVPNTKACLKAYLEVEGRRRGLLEIGYHAVILYDGTIIDCRPHTTQGSHCRGCNRTYVGVALEGGMEANKCVSAHDRCYGGTSSPCPCCELGPEDTFTEAQWKALKVYLKFTLEPHYGPLPVALHHRVAIGHPHRCPPVEDEEKWTTSLS